MVIGKKRSVPFFWKNIGRTYFTSKTTYDLRVCHEFDPGSVMQDQGHCQKRINPSRPFHIIGNNFNLKSGSKTAYDL